MQMNIKLCEVFQSFEIKLCHYFSTLFQHVLNVSLQTEERKLPFEVDLYFCSNVHWLIWTVFDNCGEMDSYVDQQ